MTTEPSASLPVDDPYAAATSTRQTPSGTVAWAMGFLAFIPVPILGSLVTGLVMLIVGNAQKDKGEVARLNGRNAANWGLTYLLLTILLVGGSFALLAISTGGGGTVSEGVSAAVFTMLGVWIFPVQIVHLVVTIAGTVKASKGEVLANRVAIPALR